MSLRHIQLIAVSPFLEEAKQCAACALAVELTTPQHTRLNLACSGCIVELNSLGFLTRFRPPMLETAETAGAAGNRQRLLRQRQLEPKAAVANAYGGIACLDPAHQSSVVIVNGGETRTRVLSMAGLGGGAAVQGDSATGQVFADVLPYSIVEVPLSEDFYAGGLEQECSWGKLKSGPVSLMYESVPADSAVDSAAGSAGTAQSAGGAPRPAPIVSSYMVYRDSNSRRIMSVTPLSRILH